MADYYKGNTTVVFFELFNEPTVMSGKLVDLAGSRGKK